MMSVQCEDIYTSFIFILLLSLNKNIFLDEFVIQDSNFASIYY